MSVPATCTAPGDWVVVCGWPFCALVLGLVLVPLACTLAGDWVVVCGWPFWPLVLLPVEPTFCLAELPPHVLSTQTGAFASTGVCALAPGLASVPPACTLAGDW